MAIWVRGRFLKKGRIWARRRLTRSTGRSAGSMVCSVNTALDGSMPMRLQQTACRLGHPFLYLGAEELMPGAYSTDLRERVLVAVEAGESPAIVAERFMVG